MKRPRRPKLKTKPGREITMENDIKVFFHCRQCLLELPVGMSPRDWSQIEAGLTRVGMQVWCRRHELNIVHVDYEGSVHPANTHNTKVTH